MYKLIFTQTPNTIHVTDSAKLFRRGFSNYFTFFSEFEGETAEPLKGDLLYADSGISGNCCC